LKAKYREVKMKALFYILILATAVLSSCSSGLYVGGEYDDLYYSPSDKPVLSNQRTVPEQIAQGNLNPEQYYDNIYANDTLIADGYNDAVDFDNSMMYNKDNSAFEYSDDFSYSNRLRRFHGNYFDPYWRDPYYSGWGNPSFGFSYGLGFSYPFYGGGMYNSLYYGNGYYDGYYGGGYYGSMFSPFYYGGYGYYPGSYYSDYSTPSVKIGRRERYSTLSNNYNTSSLPRRSYNQSVTGLNSESRRISDSPQNATSNSRRISSTLGSSRQSVSSIPEKSFGLQGIQTKRNISNGSNQISSSLRPDYKSVDRTYTPSYNNPKMSTRPSYNNSRIQSGVNSNIIQNNSMPGNENFGRRSTSGNSNTGRTNSSFSTGQSRSVTTSPGRSVTTSPGRSENYSAPTRRNMDNGSGSFSGRSYDNSSSGSVRSSYSSGSSGSVRSSSGSSESTRSSGSSSSSSSTGRRR
jgi:hypothetical protein